MAPLDPSPRLDTLQGWKEIAAYIGKSVRAAQRWERELGLPVRRLKTPSSQIIFASKQEIDAWRRRLEIEPGASVPAEADAAGPAAARSATPHGPAGQPARRRVTALWLAVTALAATALLLTWLWR